MFVLAVVIAIATRKDKSEEATTPTSKPQPAVKAATIDEAAAVIAACGKPTQDHPQELNAGAGSEGRALVYPKYNTELWFHRGPQSAQWMLMNAFLANGNDTISVEAANKRMPCMKGGLQAHFGHLEKEADEIKNQLGLNENRVKARKDYAAELDTQLLEMGIESKTFAVGQDARTLVIQDALAGRVRASQITNNSDLMAKLRLLGFRKLKYNNGFEGEMFTGFEWDLTK